MGQHGVVGQPTGAGAAGAGGVQPGLVGSVKRCDASGIVEAGFGRDMPGCGARRWGLPEPAPDRANAGLTPEKAGRLLEQRSGWCRFVAALPLDCATMHS